MNPGIQCYNYVRTINSAAVKYSIAAFLGAAFYCEWFVYRLQQLYWEDLNCRSNDTCIKILFIADPQIQGDLEFPPPFSYLFNWDSDRYLKSTFSVVMDHFEPQILVFMGDLMDEGSISTMAQFHGYVKRLLNIFSVDSPMMQIWLPGDNDIGGENEPVKRDKLKAFGEVFDQPDIIRTGNISFYKVNGMNHSFARRPEGLDDDRLRIAVSHYPVTGGYVFGQLVNTNISPHIYFCAHTHQSKYISQNKELHGRHMTKIGNGDKPLYVNFTDDILLEIFVPTCSYRMGTNSIGYGAAVVDDNGQNLRYTVFWSPRRFPYLYLYLAVLIIVIWYLLTFCVVAVLLKKCKSIKRKEYIFYSNLESL